MQQFPSIAHIKDICDKAGKKYVVFEGKVLDVNVFKHPGPQRHIVDNVGTDITTLFHRNGHSTHARILCERLVVGTVKGNPGALLSNSWCSDLSEEELAIHAKLDRDVDVRQPLLPQVRKMTNREFACFISRPRTMEDEDGIVIHADPVTDAQSKAYFYRNIRAVLPMVLLCLVLAWFAAETPTEFASNVVVFGGAGLGVMWTFLEYFFHRFVLHRELNLDPDRAADPDHLAKIFSSHLHHHVFMNQRHRIALPLWLYGLVGAPLAGLVSLILPAPMRWAGIAGVLVGSLVYDATHLAFHFDGDFPQFIRESTWFISMRSAHMRHHFRDNATEFGVTSPMWDHVLGTKPRVKGA